MRGIKTFWKIWVMTLMLVIVPTFGWVSGPPTCGIIDVIERANDIVVWNSVVNVIGYVYSDCAIDYYKVWKRFPIRNSEWQLIKTVEDSTVNPADVLTPDKDFYMGENVQYKLEVMDINGRTTVDTSIEYRVSTHLTGLMSGCGNIIGGN